MQYALRCTKQEFGLPRTHPLTLALVLRVAGRMNEMRANNFEFHSALQQAAELETDCDTGLKAVVRKVVSLYGRLTYKAMKAAGTPTGELSFWRGAFNEQPQKIGTDVRIARTQDASGQYGFLTERR